MEKVGDEVGKVGEEVGKVGDVVGKVGKEVRKVGDVVVGKVGDVVVGKVGDVVGKIDKKVAGMDVADGVGGESKVVGGESVLASDEVVCDKAARTKFAEQLEYLRRLTVSGIPLCKKYLDVGPARLTKRDVWSLIPPRAISTSAIKNLKGKVRDFTPGWLSDMVS